MTEIFLLDLAFVTALSIFLVSLGMIIFRAITFGKESIGFELFLYVRITSVMLGLYFLIWAYLKFA
ncbi:MAG: hypothetical protein AAGA69_03535, partial [Pseudomonadota bacterium]